MNTVFQSLMRDVLATFADVVVLMPPKSSLDAEIAMIRKRMKESKLQKREAFAIDELIKAHYKFTGTLHLVLAYKFNGELYYSGNKPVPFMKSTKVLHDMNMLTQTDWNNLERYVVWIKSGQIYDKVHSINH
ncbi:membrane protein [Xanthomonas phage XaC1]|nr:membrane protein [Xanthomonas phage XaC1]